MKLFETSRNLLSLTEFASVIQLNPFYLFQIGVGLGTPALNPGMSRGKVQGVTFQFAWQQSEHLGLAEIEQAIADAEEMFKGVTGFWPRPRYIENEQVVFPRYYGRDWWQGWQTIKGGAKQFQVNNRWIRSVGTELLTSVDTDVAVTRQDLDGDGIEERFTATATVPAGTTVKEVAVFYTAADRNNEPLKNYEIRPVRVTIDGTTATIEGYSWLLVKPDLQNVVNPEQLDVGAAATYVSEIDVYTRKTDTTEAGQLQWDFPNCETAPCQVAISSACFRSTDPVNGWFDTSPAEYDDAKASFVQLYPYEAWRAPDRVMINYLAGYPANDDNTMDNTMARIIAYLACALLPNKTCGVERADQRLQFYRQAPGAGQENPTDFITPEQVGYNLFPFTNGRGAILASNLIRQSGLQALKGFSAYG